MTARGSEWSGVPRPPAMVLGVPIADLTMDQTIAAIGELVDVGRRTGRTHQIATVNVDFIVNAIGDPSLRAILQHADLCLADGMPIVWGAKIKGMPIAGRVAGADLVPRLIAESERSGWQVHVFGSEPHVAERATALLAERHPAARFSIDPGPMIPDPTAVDEAVIESIRATNPDILCVALGNPKQEFFISAHRRRLGSPVMIGVGGSLDMLVGERKRAPRWMQRAGLEWIARAAQEPRRLGARYAHDIRVFTPRIARDVLAAHRRRDGAGLWIDVGEGRVLAVLGSGRRSAPGMWEDAMRTLRGDADLSIEADGPPVRDDALAALIGLVQTARRRGIAPKSDAVSPSLLSWLDEQGIPTELLGLDDAP